MNLNEDKQDFQRKSYCFNKWSNFFQQHIEKFEQTLNSKNFVLGFT